MIVSEVCVNVKMQPVQVLLGVWLRVDSLDSEQLLQPDELS